MQQYQKMYPETIEHEGRTYVNKAALAGELNYEPSSIYDLRKRGMPSEKYCKRFYYNIEDCKAWLENKNK